MKWLCFFLLFLNTEYWTLNTAFADPWKNLQHGDQSAQSFLDQMNNKKQEAGAHPFYKGTSKESHYKDTDLVGRSQSAASSDPAAQMIYQSSEARPQIKIDPQKDPLLTGSNEVMANPLEVIGGKGTQVVAVQQGGKTETIECEESGEDSSETCLNELTVKVIKIKLLKVKNVSAYLSGCKKSHKKHHPRSCPALLDQFLYWRRHRSSVAIDVTGAFKECLAEVISGDSKRCHRCGNPRRTVPTDLAADVIKSVVIERNPGGQTLIQGSTNYGRHGRLKTYGMAATLKIVYEEDSYQILPDEWSDNCARLEERVDSGLCGYVSRVCTAPHQTRIIEGVEIKRDCWQETMTYACSFPTKDDCGALRARGCAQINSACKQKVGNACVVYQQTYQCKDAPKTTFQIESGNTSTLKVPFCMDGNCRDQSWEPNDELMSSVAQLSILKEMQGNLENGFLFRGTENKCSKSIISFKDCCGSGKGWGNDLGLASCSSKEKLLNKRRKAGLCHLVGTYCDKKILGKCVTKKSSYCCFSSKLLKAFQEQGRAQIGLGWGKSKKPLCRGFTISEIQRIDFSKLDLREVFEDLMKNYKPGKMGDISRQVGERLETIKGGMAPKGLSPTTKQQPQPRAGGA